ncbi:DUF1588 domain-containing protein, partial [Gammaproteobacteria bacterium]|nr:DUF1588 domain-containing protein [Gammaproteobacteria bacterium]
MEKLAKYALTSLALLALGLSPAYSQITSNIATINSASTDGSASSSVFQLSIAADAAATALTTTMNMDIVLSLAPQQSHQGVKADVYTVIVAGGRFFTLGPDGGYSPWNGAVETLTPFVTDYTLSSNNQFTLLDGTLSEAGSYLYFAAYGIEGETRLLFTPSPAQLAVKESTTLPDETNSQAAMTFDTEVEDSIVQARCIACHVEGGLARSSALLFQRTNTASSLNNFGALSAYIDAKGSDLFLAKIAGEKGHVGGVQLAKDSSGYASFQKLIAELTDSAEATSYVFSSTSDSPSPRQASFLSEVTLEPREATLRRAALLLQGRLPTDAERKAVVSDATLRTALRNMMQGAAFREFVVTGVNDRLLIDGSDTPVDINVNNWFKIYNQKVDYAINDQLTEERALWVQIGNATRRASGELVAYVIEQEKPYSEILTADYMMMNPFANEWLEGTAVFSSSESNDVYKPSRIKGYYYNTEFRKTVDRVNSNSSYELIGSPVESYPHSGLLTDFGFLSRYPTTATNRNRARARWAFYHFLGIDIEKSSQRPTDEAALADRNNPTMNNPNCTVCHALLDPVAGAFQNWDDFNRYRGNGNDALDRFYKHPEDGSRSPYQFGDLWYRDMREPGLFDKKIANNEETLNNLAELIVAEPAFLSASAKFWWPSVFGKPMLDRPAVETDQGYGGKYAAYQAQQDALKDFASALGAGMSAKEMLVEMIMSPWFSGESVTSYAFNEAQYEAQFGSKQLLTPEQLGHKTRALTGVSWRSNMSPSGEMYSAYETFSVLLGGIDSEAVTTRATELTPTMTSILMTHATESACPAVVRQFVKPKEERSLFSLVEEPMQPLVLESRTYTLASETREDWNIISLAKSISPGDKTFSLKFLNRYCDYDGVKCVEQRTLFLKSLTVSSPSGLQTNVQAADPRIRVIGKYCSVDWQGDLRFGDGCTVEVDLSVSETGNYTLSAELSAEIPAIKGGLAEVSLSINENADVLIADTANSRAIKNQIVELFDQLHGERYTTSSADVTQVYEIYNAA